MGCGLSVVTEGGSVISVTGNTCRKGVEYAESECTDPRRMVTGSVLVRGGEWPLVPGKTESAVPKGKIFEVMDAIKEAEIHAPVYAGDVLIKNAAGTGVNVIAGKAVGLEG